MEERTMGINEARPILGDLADDAAKGIPTILTLHKRPLARIVALETETDRSWDDAVDWLLNSRHTADLDIQTAFWGIADGKCTRDNADGWAAEENYRRRNA
jgi:antitoxin (DNA-binding transcriptional repressor) of toxin-antitoxin stability system